MPNHVTNIIQYQGDPERISEMLNAIQDDDVGLGSIDFNKLVPMPPSLHIEAGSRTTNGLKAYRQFIDVYTLCGTLDNDVLNVPEASERAFLAQRTDIKPDEWELGKAAFRNFQEHGAPTWYEWCNTHWGTKWNAYGYEAGVDVSENDHLWFQTAWAAPHPVVHKLAEQFPDIHFTHLWADEDIGHNCGRQEFENGACIEEYYPDEGCEAIEFAASVMDEEPSDWGLVRNAAGNNYIHVFTREFYPVSLLGKEGLFTEKKLTEDEIPEGTCLCQLRKAADGTFLSAAKEVTSGFGGTVVLRDPLDATDGEISLSDPGAFTFLGGNRMSFEAFLDTDHNEGMVMQS